MRLEAVNGYKEKRRDNEITRLAFNSWDEEGKGKEQDHDERVEEEPG